MPRAKKGEAQHLLFWCLGCDEAHAITYDMASSEAIVLGWTWDGDLERPTIGGSVLVGGVQWGPDDDFFKPAHRGISPGGATVCHSFVSDGQIQFLDDSTHELAGRTVDLPEWPAGAEET